ncbi:MAG: guanine deaminase [Gammaproteobacteria bacterium]|nr:guanine deaminase [Gammaproteobacteria bacterium]
MKTLICGDLLHCIDNPFYTDEAVEFIEDGALLVEDGLIIDKGKRETLLSKAGKDWHIEHHPNCTLTPGFVDTHIHFPQVDVVASWGTQLLDWLETYTFPAEAQFKDQAHAAEMAEFFLGQLLANGTTTALVFGSSHPNSVNALFEAAAAKHMRLIAGKVMMDRNAPESVLDTAESSYNDSKALIERWHGHDRLSYAVTPRFAPTSTDEQLAMAGKLMREHPDVYFQTHISENVDEIAWVKSLFPNCENYLDVYKQHGLLGPRSVFAHGIHLEDRELDDLKSHQCAISHCPCSNNFIGSGLFPLERIIKKGVKVSMGTDVGGGDSYSILRNLNESYKLQQLLNHNVSPSQLLYLATLGGAQSLNLQNNIGNFQVGKEADISVLDHNATTLIKRRVCGAATWQERWFAMSILGDDRIIKGVYLLGQWIGTSNSDPRID